MKGAVRSDGAHRPHRHEPCGREADLRVRGGPRARGVQRRVGERVQLQLRQVLQGREACEGRHLLWHRGAQGPFSLHPGLV